MSLNLVATLKEKMLSEKCFILIDDEESILRMMIREHPRNFSKIERFIIQIKADDKVDVKYIPQIVSIICILFSNPKYKNVTRKEYLNIIRFIMGIILDSGFLQISESDLCNVKRVAGTSIELLIKTDVLSCYSRFKSLFSCSFSCSCLNSLPIPSLKTVPIIV
jgi:hypothetical protein